MDEEPIEENFDQALDIFKKVEEELKTSRKGELQLYNISKTNLRHI